MVTNLDETVWDNASSFVSIWAAVVDGLSPALAAIIAVLPFVMSSFGTIDFNTAFITSLVLIAFTLFFLGAYLGKISEENIPINGVRMLLVGALTGFFVWLISGLGGETAVALVF
jgi:predicted membrane protein (TIGR00267 family)